MDNFFNNAEELWRQIVTLISAWASQAPEFIAEYWEFIAVGVLVFLLIVLLILRAVGRRRLQGDKKPAADKAKPLKAGATKHRDFYEVGQRPVIVYRNTKQKAPEDDTEKTEDAQEEQQAEEELQPPAEQETPQEQKPEPESEQSTKEEEKTDQPEEYLQTDEETETQPEQDTPPTTKEPSSDQEAEEEETAETQPLPPEPEEELPPAEKQPSDPEGPTAAVDPKLIPFLESDMANEVIHLFNNLGFPVEIFYQGQYGADFVAGEKERIFIHVKDWKKKVPAYTINEARQYADAKNCSRVLVVAPAFEGGAKRAARELDVDLWNKRALKIQQRRFTFMSK